ncbi:MAG: hypothetical protein Q4C50_10255 [Eubacteriales bacterium]|nr:hypothetical protein [Eubacteriales bacterium]
MKNCENNFTVMKDVAMPRGTFRGGEQTDTETMPKGTFRGGEQTDTEWLSTGTAR